MVFSPVMTATTMTLLNRILEGTCFWKEHRDHYYQRLVRMRWSRRRLAMVEYALMLLVGLSALLMLTLAFALQIVRMVFWVIVNVVLIVRIDWSWNRFAVQEKI
jgi:hypothetical protein